MTIIDLEAVARDWLAKSPMNRAVKLDDDSKTYLVVLFKGEDYLVIETIMASTGDTKEEALANFLRVLGLEGDGQPRVCIPVRLSLGKTDAPFQIVACDRALRFDFYGN